MNIACYLFIFIFEQFISYLYFVNKFETKRSAGFIALAYALSFGFQYAAGLLYMPYLNLITFFIANLAIGILCFNAKVKQVLFNVILLEAVMISTEIVAMYAFSTVLKIDLLECKNNELIILLETAATKALYFLTAYIISKLSKKEARNSKDYSSLLFILPVSSILTISSFSYLSFTLEINRITNILFTSISMILLLSNIAVFLVHEKIVATLTANAELQLEMQKNEINKEYYTELERQYDSSNILIHDIKRTLLNIRALSDDDGNNNNGIAQYIDSIYKGYEISSLKQYSRNKLVNVIISRYANLCEESNITLCADIRDIDFSFITDSDLTALLDNLLENSYEAAAKSEGKEISVLIDRRNENYILFEIINSCDSAPKTVGGSLVSSKRDKKLHGVGTKSIERIVKRYGGDISFEYSPQDRQFSVSALLKVQK